MGSRRSGSPQAVIAPDIEYEGGIFQGTIWPGLPPSDTVDNKGLMEGQV